MVLLPSIPLLNSSNANDVSVFWAAFGRGNAAAAVRFATHQYGVARDRFGPVQPEAPLEPL
jgi:hypothetical protein